MARSPRQVRFGVGLLLAIAMGTILLHFLQEDRGTKTHSQPATITYDDGAPAKR